MGKRILILTILLTTLLSCNKSTKLPEQTLPPKEIALDNLVIDDMTIDELNALNSGNIEIIHSPTTGITRQINGIFSKIEIMSEEDALLALLNVRGIFQIPDDYSFCCLEVDRDRTEFQVFTFNQLYKGIIVDGSMFRVVATKNGTPVSVSGIYQYISDIDTTPTISAESALETVPLDRSVHIAALSLVIYVDKDTGSHLSWKYETHSNQLTECKIYYVDAHDESLINSVPTAIS